MQNKSRTAETVCFSVFETLYFECCVVLLLIGFSCMYIQNTKPYSLEFTDTVHFTGWWIPVGVDVHQVGFAQKLAHVVFYLGWTVIDTSVNKVI